MHLQKRNPYEILNQYKITIIFDNFPCKKKTSSKLTMPTLEQYTGFLNVETSEEPQSPHKGTLKYFFKSLVILELRLNRSITEGTPCPVLRHQKPRRPYKM